MMRKLTWLFALAALPAGVATARINVLVAQDFQGPNGRVTVGTHALNTFVPMQAMVGEDIRVFNTDSYRLAQEKGRLSRYDVIVLWDLPWKFNKLGGSPEAGSRVIIDPALMAELRLFVQNGGGLIIEGSAKTVFCDKYTFRNNAPNRPWGDETYFGYLDSPLRDLLAVQIDARTKRPVRAPGAIVPDELQQLVEKGVAGPELIAGQTNGSGRVLALVWGLRRDGRPWEKEGVLWNRAIRWAAGQPPADDPAQEQAQIAAYRARTLPPAERPPIAWTAEEYPYMLWVMSTSDVDAGNPLAFRYWKDLGFNYFSLHSGDQFRRGTPLKAMTNAASYGFWCLPNINFYLNNEHKAIFKKMNLTTNDYVGQNQDGSMTTHYGGPWPTPFAPKTLEVSKAMLGDTVKKYQERMPDWAMPYIKGYLMDDEQTWHMPAWTPKPGGLADFSEHAKRYYKNKTGRDIPEPVYRAPGYVAPAGDPWIQWAEVMRLRGFVDYTKEISKHLKSLQPNALVGYFAGGHWGGLDIIIDEFYHQMWKEDILKTWSSTDLGFARYDDMDGSITPYWSEIFITKSPGCFGGNKGSAVDPEQLRLTAGIAFGRGLRGLIIWETPFIWQMQLPGHEPLDGEVRAIGAFLKQYGPLLRKLKREIAPVWFLGDWLQCNSFDQYRWLTPTIGTEDIPSFPWRGSQIGDIAFPALIRAQVGAQAVTEIQLMSTNLFGRKAVVMPSTMYCREEVVTNLQEFIRRGGLVFEDESAAVKIKGAKVLPCRFDLWFNDVNEGKRLGGRALNNAPSDDISNARRELHIRDLIPIIEKEVTARINPEVTVKHEEADFWDGFASFMRNGEARYMFVYNYDLKFGRLMTVSLKNHPGQIYDLLDRSLVSPTNKAGRTEFLSQLPAGGWKIYLLTPLKFAALKVGAEAGGRELTVDVRAEAEGGALFQAAVPVEITITARNRAVTLYRSTDAGQGRFVIPLDGYLKDIQSVTVRELLTGSAKTVALSGR